MYYEREGKTSCACLIYHLTTFQVELVKFAQIKFNVFVFDISKQIIDRLIFYEIRQNDLVLAYSNYT